MFAAEPSASLSFEAHDDQSEPHLRGSWALDAFLAELDGLSASQFAAALAGRAGEDINLTLTLRNGRTARLLGSVIEDGVAHGLALTHKQVRVVRPRAPADLKLVPVFQPVVRLATGAVAGFEALARWVDSTGRVFGPDSMAEQGGLNASLGLSMVAEAADVLQSWLKKDRLASTKSLFITVNLSALDLDERQLIDAVGQAIRNHNLPPRSLRVELTEQAAMRDAGRTQGAIAALRAAGAGVILDDFAGGHSSLLWLADAAVDGIKLDARLSALALRRRGQAILRALIGLATHLGLSVTAEGIETPELAAALHQLGVRYGQGYLFAAGLSRQEATALVKARVNVRDEA
jgi:EAL domain-containing protein (putative c-di-GMP-specific phosphodiesterase class I)